MSPTTSPALPFSQACENNRAPILAVLQAAFADRRHVLEIGSGTGQHSVYFAPRLPHLVWQTSDLPENHAGIAAWHAAHPAPNLRPPLCFDLAADPTWQAQVTDPAVVLPLAQQMLLWRQQHTNRTLSDMLLRDGGIGRRPEPATAG